MRAFKTTFLVAIDENERSEEMTDPVTLEDMKKHLSDVLIVNWNVEDYPDLCGIQSVEVDIDGLKELFPDEVRKLYGKRVK
jgi:hypothetical protein